MARLEDRIQGRLGVYAVDTGTARPALPSRPALPALLHGQANLLVEMIGGPPAVTAFARTLGDGRTRIDRLEPDLNATSPGDPRDTSTPEQMAKNLRALVLGAALNDTSRQRFTDLLTANTTGDQAIRAGLPGDWTVGDKTGSAGRK